MAAVETENKVEEKERSGELLFCGATNWDLIGKKKGPADTNLVSPTRLRPLVGIDIRFVASGCSKLFRNGLSSLHFKLLVCLTFRLCV